MTFPAQSKSGKHHAALVFVIRVQALKPLPGLDLPSPTQMLLESYGKACSLQDPGTACTVRRRPVHIPSVAQRRQASAQAQLGPEPLTRTAAGRHGAVPCCCWLAAGGRRRRPAGNYRYGDVLTWTGTSPPLAVPVAVHVPKRQPPLSKFQESDLSPDES
jgi:hypothetical protein